MKAQRLFWSRTERRDYRWIFRPKSINYDALKVLQVAFSKWIGAKKAILTPRPAIACVIGDSFAVLYCCYISNRKDQFGRSIAALNGIFIPFEEMPRLKISLPFLLNNLRVWESVVEKGDVEKFEKVSDVHEVFEISDAMFFQQARNAQSWVKGVSNPLVVENSPTGYAKVLEALESPFVPLIDFSIGFESPADFTNFRSDGTTSRNFNPPVQSARQICFIEFSKRSFLGVKSSDVWEAFLDDEGGCIDFEPVSSKADFRPSFERLKSRLIAQGWQSLYPSMRNWQREQFCQF